MVAVLKYWLKLFAFLLIFFAVQRLVFVLVQLSNNPTISVLEVLKGNYYALGLDLAASAYVVLPILLLIYVGCFGKDELVLKIVRGFIITLLILIGIVHITDIGLFR